MKKKRIVLVSIIMIMMEMKTGGIEGIVVLTKTLEIEEYILFF